MIFITLGSQKFQFNRLLETVDRLVENNKITEDVFAQTGYSDYKPQHYKYKAFLNHDAFSEMEAKADIVITHGGTGAIMGAVKKGKKVIAVPRLSKYGEHVDDHQVEMVKAFVRSGYIRMAEEEEELSVAVKEMEHWSPKPFVSNTEHFISILQKELSHDG